MEKMVFDLHAIGKAIKNRYLLIGNIFLGTIMIALLINFLIPPTFEAEAILQVKPSKGLLSYSPTTDIMGTSSNSKLMSTYSEILKSRTVVQEVIDKTQSDKLQVPKYEDMLKRITMQPIRDTDVLKIKATANSPTEAQLVANALVSSFIDRLTTLARSEQIAVRDLIGQRVVESRKELDRGEDALEKYKREQKILTPSDETKAMVERMASMKTMLADNTVAAAMASAKLSSVEGQLSQESPSMIADSPLIQMYKTKLADGETELVSLSQMYGDKHPKVMANRAVIAETRARLADETAKVLNSETASINPVHQGLLLTKIQNEAELAAAAAQRVAILQVMAESEKEVATLPSKEQGISRLIRDVMVSQEIYIMLAKRYEEARIGEVTQPSEVQVLDLAIEPAVAISPQKTRNVIVGAILGLFLGLGMALFLENSRRTIDSSQEAKDYLGLPVLGVIPDFNLANLPSANSAVGKMQSLFDKIKKNLHLKN